MPKPETCAIVDVGLETPSPSHFSIRIIRRTFDTQIFKFGKNFKNLRSKILIFIVLVITKYLKNFAFA